MGEGASLAEQRESMDTGHAAATAIAAQDAARDASAGARSRRRSPRRGGRAPWRRSASYRASRP